MKKLLAFSLVVSLLFSVAPVMAAPVTLVYAEVNPLDTIVGQFGSAFKQKVEEISGGDVKIDLQAGGVLGC